MRRPVLAAAGTLALTALVVPALAADQTVNTVGTSFSPPTVSIDVGDTVTWNGSSDHNVTFDDDNPFPPATVGTNSPAHTFDAAGSYRYVCTNHPGMEGLVEVGTGGGATPTPTATAAPTASPTASPTAGTTPTATAGAGTPTPVATATPHPPVAPSAFSARTLGRRFCVRRSRRCRRPGVVLRITAPFASRSPLAGIVRRLPRRVGVRSYGSLRIPLRRGTQTFRFSRTRAGKLLRPGRYELELRATDGATAPRRVVRFTIRRR